MYRDQLRAAVMPWLGACAMVLVACDGTGPVGLADGYGPADASASAHPIPAAPVIATFEKDFMPGESSETLLVWRGDVTIGDMTGDLVSTMNLAQPGTRLAGGTLHGTVLWEVTGDLEMVFETSGVVNLTTGIVRTNGRVVSGLFDGSRVHQQGQLDADLNAAGFLRIAPATGR
jgi:hypothetical protein